MFEHGENDGLEHGGVKTNLNWEVPNSAQRFSPGVRCEAHFAHFLVVAEREGRHVMCFCITTSISSPRTTETCNTQEDNMLEIYIITGSVFRSENKRDGPIRD